MSQEDVGNIGNHFRLILVTHVADVIPWTLGVQICDSLSFLYKEHERKTNGNAYALHS